MGPLVELCLCSAEISVEGSAATNHYEHGSASCPGMLSLHVHDELAGYSGKFLPALSMGLWFCFLDRLATLKQNSLQWLPSTSKAPLGLKNFFITSLFICLVWGENVPLCLLGNHRTTCCSWLCSCTVWVLEAEPTSVTASTFYTLGPLTSSLAP